MTKLLTRARFAAAEAFVQGQGRPLDAALLGLALGRCSADDALAALVAFQNADGGFGHGLEPDLTSPASSAIATSIGLRILTRLETPARRPTVIAAIDWLIGALDREAGVWPIVGADVELAPHAPWWSWSDDLSASWNGFRFNPTAEILAHLYRFRDLAPAALIECVEAGLRCSLAETKLIENAYDLKCAIRLAEGDGLPPDLARPLDGLVRRSIAAHDPADVHASPFDAAAHAVEPVRRSGRWPDRGRADRVDRRAGRGRRLEPVLGLELRRRQGLGESQGRLARPTHSRGPGGAAGVRAGRILSHPIVPPKQNGSTIAIRTNVLKRYPHR